MSENLQRTQSDQAKVKDWFSELEVAGRGNDRDALDRLREGSLSALTLPQLGQIVAMIDAETDGVFRGNMIDALATRWAELDPEAALRFVTDRVHSNRQQSSFTKIFKVLAQQDPAKAYQSYLRTVEDVKSSHTLDAGLYQVFDQWKKVSPVDAFAAIEKGEIDEHRADSALYGACRSENDTERLAIFEAIRGLPDDTELQRKAWGKAVYSWAKTAPLEQVVSWIDSESFDQETTATMEREIARRKAKETPRAMADWLVARATAETLPGHLESAVQQWARAEPNACGEWLHGLELGLDTDRAVTAFTRATVQHDIESAFTWAQAIHDEAMRHETLRTVARKWFHRDSGRFREVVAASALSSDVQASLLETASK